MAVYEMEEVAAGTQKAMKLAVEFGAAASQAPGTMAMVMLPAPSRDTAGGAYVDREVAVPKGLYEGRAQVCAEYTQLLLVQATQRDGSPSDDAALLFDADHTASWNRGQELMPASEDVPNGHGFWYCELVPGGQ
jgi:hypothetical protein